MFGKQKNPVSDDEIAVVRCGSVREVLDGVQRGSHDVRCLRLGNFSVYMDADRVVNACEGEESFAPMFAECFPDWWSCRQPMTISPFPSWWSMWVTVRSWSVHIVSTCGIG